MSPKWLRVLILSISGFVVSCASVPAPTPATQLPVERTEIITPIALPALPESIKIDTPTGEYLAFDPDSAKQLIRRVEAGHTNTAIAHEIAAQAEAIDTARIESAHVANRLNNLVLQQQHDAEQREQQHTILLWVYRIGVVVITGGLLWM